MPGELAHRILASAATDCWQVVSYINILIKIMVIMVIMVIKMIMILMTLLMVIQLNWFIRILVSATTDAKNSFA